MSEYELEKFDESIRDKIYSVRGYQVMLDRDLAELYGVETKVLNQAVKRNLKRFPQNYCFQFTHDEYEILILSADHKKNENLISRSQIVTSILAKRNLGTMKMKRMKIFVIYPLGCHYMTVSACYLSGKCNGECVCLMVSW